APAAALAPRLLPSAELLRNCESEIVAVTPGRPEGESVGPPVAKGAPPLLGWLPVKGQWRMGKLAPGWSLIAPPLPPTAALLPPWARLFAKVHSDTAAVMPDPVKGTTEAS